MADADTPTLAQVFNFLNSFHEQCRNLVRDAVRLVRDERGIFLTHKKEWDYAAKPNDRFLDQDYSCVRRCWMPFIPAADVSRGALFHFEFFHPKRPVTPALMYGTVDPGTEGFENMDRWAAHDSIAHAEQGESTVTISDNGPLTIVRSERPGRFKEAVFVRVPLESIVDHAALVQHVVHPLLALLCGDWEDAKRCLSETQWERWPLTTMAAPDDEEDESEQV